MRVNDLVSFSPLASFNFFKIKKRRWQMNSAELKKKRRWQMNSAELIVVFLIY